MLLGGLTAVADVSKWLQCFRELCKGRDSRMVACSRVLIAEETGLRPWMEMDGADSWNAGGQTSLIYIVCGYMSTSILSF